MTLPVQIVADGTTGISAGGFIVLQGRDLITNDLVRANGGSQSLGGVIALQGCNVTVNQSSEIRALGQNGSNTITGSGQITIRGKMTTAAGGTNTIVYRDPSMPPSITGTVSPAPVKTVDPTLPPCPGSSAACGNGTPDPGEECDDGNTTSCDGCSASCRVEGCGNGRVECSEECDAGRRTASREADVTPPARWWRSRADSCSSRAATRATRAWRSGGSGWPTGSPAAASRS